MKLIMKQLKHEVSGFNEQINQFENLIKVETDKVSPLREKI